MNLSKEWSDCSEPALWRDHAFFDPDVLYLTENLLSTEGGPNLVFDLKWSTETEARARMGRYLRHITMLSLAEINRPGRMAPSDVPWHFSYPISMHSRDDYQGVIKEQALKEQVKEFNVIFHSESQAAFNYFMSIDLIKPTAMLVIDIGGGSTDILLWRRRASGQEGAMVWQHSLRLAGDHLMTEFLVHNRDLLKHLGIAEIGREGGQGVFGDDECLSTFMDPPTDQQPGTADLNVARAIINSSRFAEAFKSEVVQDKGRRGSATASGRRVGNDGRTQLVPGAAD